MITRMLPSVMISSAMLLASHVQAQNSSLFYEDLPVDPQGPTRLQDGSWTYRATPPPPEEVKLHDRVIVRVDEIQRMQSLGDVERRKNALLDAVLNDWVHLIGLKALKPDAQRNGDQRIRGQLQELYRAESDLETRESLAFNIACFVVDIRPNGLLVLEGHKQIRVNHESWDVSLSGICDPHDVGPDGVILSTNIGELIIDKREHGHVRDGYKRGWLARWMDEFSPF